MTNAVSFWQIKFAIVQSPTQKEWHPLLYGCQLQQVASKENLIYILFKRSDVIADI